MITNLFSKEEDGYTRYWISVSTERTDKQGDGTGEYINASITCRLSKKAAETYAELATKTKNKSIKLANVKLIDWWFKAAETKDSDETYVLMFINSLKDGGKN